MTAARGVALLALVAVIAVVAAVLLRNGDTTTYRLRFADAGQLVKDDDVQVGGRRVGSVRAIKLTDDTRRPDAGHAALAGRHASRGPDDDPDAAGPAADRRAGGAEPPRPDDADPGATGHRDPEAVPRARGRGRKLGGGAVPPAAGAHRAGRAHPVPARE